MAKPQLIDGTSVWLQDILQLTKIAEKIEMFKGMDHKQEDIESFRLQTFAGAIDPCNKLEGATFALTDCEAELVYCHLDKFNCNQPGHNGVVVASQLAVELEENKDPNLCRSVAIGYDRRGCHDYVKRVELSWPLICDARQWLNSIAKERIGINSSTFLSYFKEIVEGVMFTRESNIDKNAFYSPFLEIFFRLHEKFNLTMQQCYEILLPIAWVPTPFEYWGVLTRWIDSGLLPKNNLLPCICRRCIQII